MNICKVVFYYIGILTVSIVFVKMLYELITKKYKKKLVMDDSRKNTKIQYFQILFYIVGIIFFGNMCFYNRNIWTKRFTLCLKKSVSSCNRTNSGSR